MRQQGFSFAAVDRQPVVVSYGLGTDSTAMIVELVSRQEPIDLIVFADTGAEKPNTYAYLPIFDKWLRSKGYPGITVVRHQTRDGRFETLEERSLRLGMLPSLAYGFKKCSQKYKHAPISKFENHWTPARQAWAAGLRVVKLIGFDCGEQRRIDKTPWNDPKYEYRYPLSEWGWNREKCIARIALEGLPQPGKSACFFCPASKKPEILELAKNHPDLAARACALEAAAAPNLTTTKGLGRRFAWTDFLRDHGIALAGEQHDKDTMAA